MGNSNLAVSHPFGQSTGSTNVVSRRDVQLGTQEQGSEHWNGSASIFQGGVSDLLSR